MALKSTSAVFMVLIFVGVMAVSSAPKAEAQGLDLTQILGIIQISGIVPCTVNPNVNGLAVPPFPDATVVLQCGGTTVTSTTTNISGQFSISLNDAVGLVTTLLSCNIVVTTPLSTCNVALPTTGNLLSSLALLGSGGVLGGLPLTTLVPTLFQLVNTSG